MQATNLSDQQCKYYTKQVSVCIMCTVYKNSIIHHTLNLTIDYDYIIIS
jgi:hypothetical protein